MEDHHPENKNPQHCRLMNANNSSTRNLPNEILSSIFELVCVPSGADVLTEFEDIPKRPRITLASVCSHWHDVIWNTPQLWPKLSVNICGYYLQKAASTLQMFADNHATPGFLDLDFPRSGDCNFEELLSPLDALLSRQTAPRIRHLGLRNLKTGFTAIATLIRERCCNIQTLSLSCGFLPYRLLSLSSNNRPRPKFEPPTYWPTITTLNLYHMPMDTFFDLLFSCQQLTSLRCDQFDEPINHPTEPPSYQGQTVVLPDLTFLALATFQWPQSATWIDAFLQIYRFPSLKQLHWSIHPSKYSLEPFHTFLSALPISCDTIYFDVMFVGPSDNDGRPNQGQCLEAALAHVGQVKHLIVSNNHEVSELEVMWRLLADYTFLPSLERFSYYTNLSPDHRTYVYGISGLFRGRKEAGAKAFHLDIPDRWFKFPDWENQRAELSRLMIDGSFEVEIYHGNKKLVI